MEHITHIAHRINTTIFTRHSADCSSDDPQNKRCGCWRHLRYAIKKNGKSVMKWQATKERTWAGAVRFQREFEQANDPNQPKTQPIATVTVRDAADMFIKDKRGQNVVASTADGYQVILDRLDAYLATAGVFRVVDVKLHHLTAFRATWPSMYPESSTRHQVQGQIKTFFKYASIAYELPRNPALGLSSIKVDTQPTLPFSPDEYRAILNAIPVAFPDGSKFPARMLALTELMRWSGLAIRDAVCIRRDAIQKGRDGITRIVTSRQKTKVLVRVPLPQSVAETLDGVTNDYGWGRGLNRVNYVFWDGTSPKAACRSYWGAFKTIFEKAGIEGGHPHRFRDTFAVECLKSRRVSLWQLSKLLGHTNTNTTQKHYAPWVQELQDQLDEAVISSWEKK